MPRLLACLALLPAAAFGSGFSFGENGAKALSMGGAFAGQADDLTAIQHNPAGLQQLQGFHFLADLSLLNVDMTFQRTDASGDPGQAHAVSNIGGIFPLPFVGVGYGTKLADRRFHIALGVYGPPADGHLQYPSPEQLCTGSPTDSPSCVDKTNGGAYSNDPRKYAPQRYGFIGANTLIAYPSLAVSFEPIHKFSIGASLQYVYADLQFSQDATSQPTDPAQSPTAPLQQRFEDPHWDDLIKTHFHGNPTFTGVFGVMYRHCDCFQIGASIRPPIVLNASGTMDVTPGYYATTLVGAKVSGDHANFQLTLPMEIRVGIHFTPNGGPFSLNADFVYEGWHRLTEFVLTPTDIQLQVGANAPSALGQITIPKHWHDTYGARLGASYRFGFGLTARAGVMYDPTAIPEERTNIDFPNFNRLILTAGAGYPVGPVDVLLTGAFVTPTQLSITDSQVLQTNTNCPTPNGSPGCRPNPVGDGTFTAGGWIASLGVRGHFGGEPEKEKVQ